jgi:hypothetical protein
MIETVHSSWFAAFADERWIVAYRTVQGGQSKYLHMLFQMAKASSRHCQKGDWGHRHKGICGKALVSLEDAHKAAFGRSWSEHGGGTNFQDGIAWKSILPSEMPVVWHSWFIHSAKLVHQQLHSRVRTRSIIRYHSSTQTPVLTTSFARHLGCFVQLLSRISG